MTLVFVGSTSASTQLAHVVKPLRKATIRSMSLTTLFSSSTQSHLQYSEKPSHKLDHILQDVFLIDHDTIMTIILDHSYVRLLRSSTVPPKPSVENQNIHVFPHLAILQGIKLQNSTNLFFFDVYQVVRIKQNN